MVFSAHLQDLLFPRRCLSCGVNHDGLCGLCRDSLQIATYYGRISHVPIYSSALYNKTASRILLHSKEQGVKAADAIVIDLLRLSHSRVLQDHGEPFSFVPIPSSRRAVRKRGRRYVADLARTLTKDDGIPVHDILLHRRRVVDQSTLSAKARRQNLTWAMELSNNGLIRHPVLVIDDLWTTGSTFREAIRCLQEGGYEVIAGITAFVAQPLR